jgi:hypothetical protein
VVTAPPRFKAIVSRCGPTERRQRSGGADGKVKAMISSSSLVAIRPDTTVLTKAGLRTMVEVDGGRDSVLLSATIAVGG